MPSNSRQPLFKNPFRGVDFLCFEFWLGIQVGWLLGAVIITIIVLMT